MPKYYESSTRAQVVALLDFGAPIKDIAARTGVQERSQRKMMDRAKERGFTAGCAVLNVHVEDAAKSGAPRKRTQSFNEEVAAKVRVDRYALEKNTAQMAEEFKDEGRNVSAMTV